MQLRPEANLELSEQCRRTNADALDDSRGVDRHRRFLGWRWGQALSDRIERLIERPGEFEEFVFGQDSAEALLERGLSRTEDE